MKKLNYEAMKLIDQSMERGQIFSAQLEQWKREHTTLLASYAIAPDGSEHIESDGKVVKTLVAGVGHNPIPSKEDEHVTPKVPHASTS